MGEPNGSLTSAVTVAPETIDQHRGQLLRGRTLVIGRVLWAVILGVVLTLTITAIPARYESVRTQNPDIRAPEFRDLIDAGVPSELAAICDVTVALVFVLVVTVGGIVLFARASDRPEALFLSVTMIVYGPSFSGLMSVHRTRGFPLSQSLAGIVATILYIVTTSGTFTALFWLPYGRFTSRSRAAFTALLVIIAIGLYLFVSYPRAHDLVNVIAIPVSVIGIASQLTQYRMEPDPTTRQRIKWAVIGIVIAALGTLAWGTGNLVIGDREGLAPRIILVALRVLQNAGLMAVPVCVSIAIFQYGLWQVDLVINRSLVYGAVTAALVLVFLGGGFALQRILGQGNAAVAFALSTICAGLLFNPALVQAQRVIDRRVFGLRFDLNQLKRAQRAAGRPGAGALTGHWLGKYRVLSLLGAGGMGEVYQGERDGQLVAIKIVPQTLGEKDFSKWFARETEALAGISHPNIVKFHESGETDGVRYIVLDFVDGRDLSDIIRERGRIPLGELQPLLHDLASALDYAHDQGLVHRDIKPSNIMIRRSADGSRFEAVLMDFGIAKTSDAQTVRTSTGGAVGTISYMAPEQIRAARNIDRRADIYALGVTVYEALTGAVPFRGSPAQVLFAHLQEQPLDPREVLATLPPSAARGVLRALEKKPEDRFYSVGQFVSALVLDSERGRRPLKGVIKN